MIVKDDEKEVFVKAYNIIKDPEKWTQGWHAKDEYGNYVSGNSPDAVCWCSTGAITHAAINNSRLGEAIVHAFKVPLAYFNDTHSHEEVMALWEKVGKAKGWL